MNRLLVILALGLVAAIPTAQAQNYPSRPIRFIVGFPAGGGSDLIARRVAERLAPRLGQPVVVENRPGAGAAIAAQSVIQAEPDGYTLYAAGGSMTAFKLFNKDLTFDVRTDLAPVGKYADSVAMLVVNAKTPANNLREFLALVKASPGKYAYGTPGGTVRLGLEALRMQAGLDMLHVQYKGAADYSVALLAEQVHLIIDNPATQAGNLESGKVKFLAVTSRTRSLLYPNIPTASEAGLPGWEYANWSAMLAPAKTPRPIIERLAREVTAIARSDEFRDDTLKWSRGGYQPVSATPEELASAIATEMKMWEDVARAAKVE